MLHFPFLMAKLLLQYLFLCSEAYANIHFSVPLLLPFVIVAALWRVFSLKNYLDDSSSDVFHCRLNNGSLAVYVIIFRDCKTHVSIRVAIIDNSVSQRAFSTARLSQKNQTVTFEKKKTTNK
jgi:hypothetical protein